MVCRKRSTGLLLLLFVLYISAEAKKDKGRIVHRPGKNPVRCRAENGQTKCVEVNPDDLTEEDRKEIDDPHDMEKGPNGGKLYRLGDYGLECFKDGQCSRVEKEDLPPDPKQETEPETESVEEEEDEEERGVFYRHGDVVIECFPDGSCKEVDLAELEAAGIEVPEDSGPGTVIKDDKSDERERGVFYRHGDVVVECFPDGNCVVVDLAELEAAGIEVPENSLGKVIEDDESDEGERGVFYRHGDVVLECFPNGSCKEVDLAELEAAGIEVPEDSGPGTVIKDDKSDEGERGVFYRHGDVVVECFPDGNCVVVDLAELEAAGIEVPEDSLGKMIEDDESDEGERGVFYRHGDVVLECFPNDSCKEVDLAELEAAGIEVPEDSGPGTVIKDDKSVEGERGVFYRHGDVVVECFPDGNCVVVDLAELEAAGIEVPEDSLGKVIEDDESDDEESEEEEEIEISEESEEEVEDSEKCAVEWNEVYGDSGDANKSEDYNGDASEGAEDNGDASKIGEDNSDSKEEGLQGIGKGVCTFKDSAKIKGSIVLVEEHFQTKMKVIGKIHGLKEGMHVMTFHEKGDVKTPACTGVGPYKRPKHLKSSLVLGAKKKLRLRRQVSLFKSGEKTMFKAYRNCMRHVKKCKAKKLKPKTCEKHLNRCVPILKCRKCRAQIPDKDYTSFDTVEDLEKTGQFKFCSVLPKKSLILYADEKGEANFNEVEREQTMRGKDSVIGGSISVSIIPDNKYGEFTVKACCKIEVGGPMIII